MVERNMKNDAQISKIKLSTTELNQQVGILVIEIHCKRTLKKFVVY